MSSRHRVHRRRRALWVGGGAVAAAVAALAVASATGVVGGPRQHSDVAPLVSATTTAPSLGAGLTPGATASSSASSTPSASRQRRARRSASAQAATGSAPAATGSASALGATPAITGTTTSLLAAGAVGDGTTDDTAAIQRALDALQPGDALLVPAGRTFAHSGVLHLRVPRTAIIGSGTLLATNPASSALWVEADGTTVSGVHLVTSGATTRLGTWNDVDLRVAGTTGTTVSDVTITGGASAGVMVDQSSAFTLRRVSVSGTLADGITVVDASHDGTLDHVSTSGTGDDGISIVAYRNLPQVHDITVTSPVVDGTTWGRGISDVGGRSIRYTDVSVTGSNAAAVYIADEPGWNTYAPSDVSITGGTLRDANTSSTVDHGALMVYDGDPTQTISGITVDGLAIAGTNPARSREVGLIAEGNAPITGVVMKGVSITGSGPATFVCNTSAGRYSLQGWTRDGTSLADASS